MELLKTFVVVSRIEVQASDAKQAKLKVSLGHGSTERRFAAEVPDPAADPSIPTIGQMVAQLSAMNPEQRLVFTEDSEGDFDPVGPTGTAVSEDNFVHDRRPVYKLQGRNTLLRGSTP